MTQKSDKIIIVGAGVYGLSTSLSLLEQGYTDVHLFDKNDYLVQKYEYIQGCDSASSDMNKVFRCAYGEKVHYQKMALKSREKFLEWNKMIKDEGFEGGEPLYINNGNVHLTDQNELPVFETDTLIRLKDGDQAINITDSDAEERTLKKGLPAASVNPFKGKRALNGVLDTTGGTMIADKCCRWVLHLCQKVGGDSFKMHFGSSVGSIDKLLVEHDDVKKSKKCIGIKTMDGGKHLAKATYVFGGSWTSQIVMEANERVEATGGTVVMMKIDEEELVKKYSEKHFPTWTFKIRDGALGGLYGFPVRDGYMKVGYRGLKWTNPQGKINSKTKTAFTEEQGLNVPLFGLLMIKNFLSEFFPEMKNKITKTRLCWYSDTEDNDFLISYCPYYTDKSLFVGAGDSGHAFMMLGSLGDVITDIILDRGDAYLKELFSWEREREKLNVINQGINDPRALQNQKMATKKDWKFD